MLSASGICFPKKPDICVRKNQTESGKTRLFANSLQISYPVWMAKPFLKICVALLTLAAVFLTGFSLVSAATGGENLVLEMPVGCVPGRNCSIQNYVDRDPGPGYRDYTCGFLSSNGHRGTDFRAPYPVVMGPGVQVLAAAPGIVRAVRDGMPDISIRKTGKEAVKGREAGNAVVVDHGHGWETQYSHLRKGSVTVKKGQRVVTGQVLGLIGMSGMTEFPHLHFEVRRHGLAVDPFVGLTDRDGCGFAEKPLWSKEALKKLSYVPTGLLGAGFTSGRPDPEKARQGKHQAEFLSPLSPAILFWTDVFGLQAGDEADMRILGPAGKVLAAHRDTVKKPLAQRFLYIGKRRKEPLWRTGTYTGEYILRRNTSGKKTVIINIRREIEIRQ